MREKDRERDRERERGRERGGWEWQCIMGAVLASERGKFRVERDTLAYAQWRKTHCL